MKLKYYMRGVGIGVVVTTLILLIAFVIFGNNEMSDEDVIKRAKSLGMVQSSSTINDAKNETTEQQNNATSENNLLDQNVQNAQNSATQDVNNEFVQFTINSGESSRMVIDRLAEQGLVSDPTTFNRFLNEKGLDNNIQPGTFNIPRNISDNDLATLLSTKQKFREQ